VSILIFITFVILSFLQSLGEERDAVLASQQQQTAELHGEVGKLRREVKKWKVSL
jgi:hypothetical protein